MEGKLVVQSARGGQVVRVTLDEKDPGQEKGPASAPDKIRARPAVRRSGWNDLTPGELKVVDLVLEGLNNPQIGERLEISKRTVSSHLSAVFRKLGLNSRIDLILQAPALKRQAARSRDRR